MPKPSTAFTARHIANGRVREPYYRIQPRTVPPKGTPLFTCPNTRESVENFLLAFGDTAQPLPETVRVLDEIVVDYIIVSCHEAAAAAHYSKRAKIKLEDFRFMLRGHEGKLGRVSEMLELEKDLKSKRKAFDTNDEVQVGKGVDVGEEGAGAGEKVGEKRKGVHGDGEGEGGEKKKKKKRKNREGDGHVG